MGYRVYIGQLKKRVCAILKQVKAPLCNSPAEQPLAPTCTMDGNAPNWTSLFPLEG